MLVVSIVYVLLPFDCEIKMYIIIIMDARSAMRPCYILPMFLYIFLIPALVGQTAERIFTKLSHVVDIRCYLRTY